MKNSIGYIAFEKDFSTHSWLTWCKSKMPVWLTLGFVIFFDLYVPTRFESGREVVPVPRVTAIREVPKYGVPIRCLWFPCSSQQTRCCLPARSHVYCEQCCLAVVPLSGLQGNSQHNWRAGAPTAGNWYRTNSSPNAHDAFNVKLLSLLLLPTYFTKENIFNYTSNT